jgi:hypothetical protein
METQPEQTRKLDLNRLAAHRAVTFRTGRGLRLRRKDEAYRFVDERGFVHFWPIKDIVLPSLWAAVAGDRPVADAHDDPGHITWGWKDSELGGQNWYYAKVLRKKATMISMDLLPYFYALSNNYGSPEDDYLTLYEQGKLTQEARLVYETLLREGALDTIELRKATRMTNRESNPRFAKALSDLQADFKITPIGISPAGRWRYAFIYQLTPRRYPDLIDRTRQIGERQARRRLVECYLRSVGAAQLRDLTMLFGWPQEDTMRALDEMVQQGLAVSKVEVSAWKGNGWALTELLDN